MIELRFKMCADDSIIAYDSRGDFVFIVQAKGDGGWSGEYQGEKGLYVATTAPKRAECVGRMIERVLKGD